MVASAREPRRRIRFINPNSALTTITMPDVVTRMTMGRKAIFAPTGLTICAAVMPRHWDVEVVDECTMSAPHGARADVDIVGITAMTTQARRAYEIADAYRALGVTVVMGGIHPSAMPEDALRHCDAVCKGDAESTLPQLIADWEAGKGKTSKNPNVETSKSRNVETGKSLEEAVEGRVPRAENELARGNGGIDRAGGEAGAAAYARCASGIRRIYDWAQYAETEIATPRKDLLDPRQYLIANPIQTTRGCPHTCSFCTTPGVFGRKFRQRKISDIVEEIREAKERFNSWAFIFADDDFGGNHKWALEMCAALEPLKIAWASQCDILISRNDKLLEAMKRSGCVGLILGLESRKQDTLSESGKRFVKSDSYEWRIRKIQSYGISLWGAFIFGFDHDDWRDLMYTTRWAQRMNLCMSCYPILTPYPGTEFYRQFERDGRITTREWDKYNGATVVYEPKRMSPQQLRHAQMAAFAEFYSWRSALRRLGVFPLKKRAWAANLGIVQGIRYYYARRGRQIPRFSDFRDPAGPAWNYQRRSKREQSARAVMGPEDSALAASAARRALDEADDAMAATCCTPSPSLAQLAVSHADPFNQAARALGVMDRARRSERQ